MNAATTVLDWSDHQVTVPRPCRLCGQPALLRDRRGRPTHKTCAERLLDQETA